MPRSRLLAIAIGAVLVSACGSSSVSSESAGPRPSAEGSGSATPSAPSSATPTTGSVALEAQEFDVPAGTHPHDVAPATDGGIWYTGQQNGVLGHLDPATGSVREIPLGAGSAPHGVITGADGAAWITDGGLNAIVRVDAATDEVRVFKLPTDRPGANLNTAAFGADGILWFTGQSGIYGRLDPKTGDMAVLDDPEGRGPYGITSTPAGEVWYASLAGSHIARIDPASGAATIVEPPTQRQGSRRVWSDSLGRIWVSEWDAGQVGVHDPGTGAWQEWRLPGDGPQAYAVYVDDARHRVADGLRRQRHRPLRSSDRELRPDHAAELWRRRPPASRPARRGLGRRVRDRQAGPHHGRLNSSRAVGNS